LHSQLVGFSLQKQSTTSIRSPSVLTMHDWFTEVRGESPAVYGGDESDNSATTAGTKPPDSVSRGTHNQQKLAVGLGSARTTKATTPFPRGRLRGRGDTAGKTRPSLVCACPPWHEGQAGRWHGPCPDAGKPATGGIPAVSPRRTGCTVQADTASEWTRNTPHPSRGRRIAHEPGIASPDPIRQARRCQRGRGTGPLSRAGILALQGAEDVKDRCTNSSLREQRPSPLHVAVGVPATGIADSIEEYTRIGG
jgi:hypothetical protein